MTDRIDDTPFNSTPRRGNELSVGAGASIMLAVATSLILVVTLLFASLTPVRAAEIAPAVATLDSETGAIRPAGDPVPFVTALPRDMIYAIAQPRAASPAGSPSGSLAMIVVMAVLAGWLVVSADLWRALFNRVKSWDRSRS